MNREIKFRAWDKKRKRFISEEKDSFCFPQDIIFDIFKGQFDGCCYNDIKRSKYIVLQQYTGLKDKNGKEIYEGDIISHGKTYTPYTVEYNDKIGGFTADGMPFNINEGRYVDTRTVEVIGNIFENIPS